MDCVVAPLLAMTQVMDKERKPSREGVLAAAERVRGHVTATPLLLFAALGAAGCKTPASPADTPFVISAIPDQDPERLQRLYGLVSSYLSAELKVPDLGSYTSAPAYTESFGDRPPRMRTRPSCSNVAV